MGVMRAGAPFEGWREEGVSAAMRAATGEVTIVQVDAPPGVARCAREAYGTELWVRDSVRGRVRCVSLSEFVVLWGWRAVSRYVAARDGGVPVAPRLWREPAGEREGLLWKWSDEFWDWMDLANAEECVRDEEEEGGRGWEL